ncbi:MAG: short chain dehydrogenase [Proteobacteria bacterium]|nr:MAG: short chain dehydrogenase [Pseudomonadota bacterium]
MDLELENRVAVVTGGTSGIGLATARLFLVEGAMVAICGRDPSRLAAAQSSLADKRGNGRLLAQTCDVLDKAAVAQFATAVGEWSGGRCDILVNNAGQARMSTFADTTDEAWREELELKFFSQIHPVRAFKPMLEQSDAAAILTVNSLLAYQPEPYMVATSAARAGAQNLVKSLAHEFAPRIRVNSVLLGLIDSGQWERRFAVRPDPAQTRAQWYGEIARTRQIPLERLGEPEEVARAIAFLCSPVAGFITGAQLEISGGTSRHM